MLVKSKGQQHFLAQKRPLAVDGMEGFSKGLEMKEVSFNAAERFTDARREGL